MRELWRPKLYDSERYKKLAEEYLDSCEDKYEKVVISESRSSWKFSQKYDYRLEVNLPSIQWFAKYCGLHRSTMYDWYKKYPDFSDIIETIKNTQITELIRGGLSWKYNARITALLLCRLGYLDGGDYKRVRELS